MRDMNADAAAWIREHAWTQPMRKTFAEVPGFYLKCACQSGLTSYCQNDRHEQCHRAEPLRSHETWILRHGGAQVAHFAEVYAHETDTSATGPKFTTAAQVWLADRVCRWICPCDCEHTGKQVVVVEDEQPDSRPIVDLQLDIFGELVGA